MSFTSLRWLRKGCSRGRSILAGRPAAPGETASIPSHSTHVSSPPSPPCEPAAPDSPHPPHLRRSIPAQTNEFIECRLRRRRPPSESEPRLAKRIVGRRNRLDSRVRRTKYDPSARRTSPGRPQGMGPARRTVRRAASTRHAHHGKDAMTATSPAARPRPWPALLVLLVPAACLVWAFWPTLGRTRRRPGTATRNTPTATSCRCSPPSCSGCGAASSTPAALRPSWWGLLAAGRRPRPPAWRGVLLLRSGSNKSPLLPCVAGLCLLAGGRAAWRWAWPAVLFLAFMIPLPFTRRHAAVRPAADGWPPLCQRLRHAGCSACPPWPTATSSCSTTTRSTSSRRAAACGC